MAYDQQSTYNKFNRKSCGCEDKSKCGCPEPEKCGCCPVGLIEIKDKDEKSIGCLSPNDAQEYMKNTYRCSDGYIRVFDEAGNFIGCLTPDEYAVYAAAIA